MVQLHQKITVVVEPNADGLRLVVSFSAWWACFRDVTFCLSACGEGRIRVVHVSTFTSHHTAV